MVYSSPRASTSTFHDEDWTILSRFWHPAMRAGDLGKKPVQVTILDARLVIYRAGDEVVVAPDLCPHRGLPLSMGSESGEGIRCRYHGLQFGSGGQCTHVPAHPDHKIPQRLHLKTIRNCIRYGLIWVNLDNTASEEDIPEFPGWDNTEAATLVCPGYDISAFAGRQIEGFLDVAHFAFVHADTFADPNNQEVPEYTTTPTEKGFTADYYSSVANYPHGTPVPDNVPEDFLWRRHFSLFAPFTATLTVHFPQGGLLHIMNAACPVSAQQTRMFSPIARTINKNVSDEEIIAFNQRIFHEDKEIVEHQKPEYLPLDPRLEVNIPADRSSVAYRQTLKKMGLSTFFTA